MLPADTTPSAALATCGANPTSIRPPATLPAPRGRDHHFPHRAHQSRRPAGAQPRPRARPLQPPLGQPEPATPTPRERHRPCWPPAHASKRQVPVSTGGQRKIAGNDYSELGHHRNAATGGRPAGGSLEHAASARSTMGSDSIMRALSVRNHSASSSGDNDAALRP